MIFLKSREASLHVVVRPNEEPRLAAQSGRRSRLRKIEPAKPVLNSAQKMAARLRHQGLGRRFTLGFGGELDLGGLIDQQLEESVPDALLAEKAKQLRQRHPCLERRMRSAEVWGGSISSLLADATVVSLASPFTMHPHRSRVAGGGAASRT